MDSAGNPIPEMLTIDSKEVTIYNLRTEEKRPDLMTNGLAYVTNRQVPGLEELQDQEFALRGELLARDSVKLVKEM